MILACVISNQVLNTGLERIVMVSLSLTVFGLVPVTLFSFRLLRRLLIWLSELSLAVSGEFPKQLTVS